MMRALIFIPDGSDARHEQECIQYCQRRDHQVVAVTDDRAGVAQMLGGALADVVVIARPEHAWLLLPPSLEVVTGPHAGLPPRQRRTRRLGRGEAVT